jgi:hypothetical protein
MNPSVNAVKNNEFAQFTGSKSRIISGFDDSEESSFSPAVADEIGSSNMELNSHGKIVATVETEGGKRVRVPGPGAYPGEPPYSAPMTGFHGKATDIFDAFAYLPSGQPSSERPKGFFSVVGLAGDDAEKRDNPAWSLFARMKPEVYKKVEEEFGDMKVSAFKPVILVNGMRAENMAMFSVSQPHQMFGASLWLAAAPIAIMNHPVPVLDGNKVKALVLADRALEQVDKLKNSQPKAHSGQFSLAF